VRRLFKLDEGLKGLLWYSKKVRRIDEFFPFAKKLPWKG